MTQRPDVTGRDFTRKDETATMCKGRGRAYVPVLVAATLLSLHCGDSSGPERQAPGPLTASHVPGSGIRLDQQNGFMGVLTDPFTIVKGFNPTNPHVGDAIVATFFWFGTPGAGNIIDSVTDVLTTAPFTPVGNKYELVEFVSSGNISMATYVATNVQNFPDAGTDPSQILAIKADLSVPVTDGGVLMTAWIGVAGVSPQAIGEHKSASGIGIPDPITGAPTIADPGEISVNAGALAYGVSLVSPPSGVIGPPDWTSLATLSDLVMSSDGRYDARFTVSPSGGSAHPQWSWFFTVPGTWLASVLALNPAVAAPTTASLTVTTNTSGENLPTVDYTVTLDGTTSQSISPNGEITFTDLQPGDHEVALSGVPENCEVTTANPVTVTVVAGEIATATFTVVCSAPPPPPPPPPVCPPNDDDDNDGLNNRNETVFHTLVWIADSDGDGIADGNDDANRNGIDDEDEDDNDGCPDPDRDGDGIDDEDEDDGSTGGPPPNTRVWLPGVGLRLN